MPPPYTVISLDIPEKISRSDLRKIFEKYGKLFNEGIRFKPKDPKMYVDFLQWKGALACVPVLNNTTDMSIFGSAKKTWRLYFSPQTKLKVRHEGVTFIPPSNHDPFEKVLSRRPPTPLPDHSDGASSDSTSSDSSSSGAQRPRTLQPPPPRQRSDPAKLAAAVRQNLGLQPEPRRLPDVLQSPPKRVREEAIPEIWERWVSTWAAYLASPTSPLIGQYLSVDDNPPSYLCPLRDAIIEGDTYSGVSKLVVTGCSPAILSCPPLFETRD
ncbi:MAG: uncharacterized protein KVP18_002066 [Porospora cf. gigantea A]|uniref:uncharacterized protein n=2 Tax=Porospora cf. gigantea A TaxID=2853593 RepID=UPI003559BEA8|nr:MAG: hypothetical protein KVP18_002066 [Porospora cf. gigantea A]